MMRIRRRRVPHADESQNIRAAGEPQLDLAPNSGRSGFYIAHKATPSVAERLWPWILVTVSLLASAAAMAR
jgi:hypothetical protein